MKIPLPRWLWVGFLIGSSVLMSNVSLFGQDPDCNSLQNVSATYLGAGRGATMCSQAVYRLEYTLSPFDSCQSSSPKTLAILAVDPVNPANELPVEVTDCASVGGLVQIEILAPVFASGQMQLMLVVVDSMGADIDCPTPLTPPIDVPNIALTVSSPSVENALCGTSQGETNLSWSIPTHAQYTNIIVERRPSGADPASPTTDCTLLQGDATSFTEMLPPLPTGQLGWQYTVIGLMGGDCGVPGACAGLPVTCEVLPTSAAFFDIADMVTVSSGEMVEVPVLLSHSGSFGLVAFGFGVTHDPAVLTPCMTPAIEGDALNALVIAGFVYATVGMDGVSVGAVMDAGIPSGNFTPIPLGSDLEIVRLCYEVTTGAVSGETALQFAALAPNTTPIQAVCLRPNPTIPGGADVGEDVSTITSDNGSVLVIGDFVRGDLDGSFTPTVTDVVILLRFLFPTMGVPDVVIGCMDAADVDDDGVVNIADPLYLLAFTFGAGPPPPDPTFMTFTDADCGPDTVSDSLDCMTSFCP